MTYGVDLIVPICHDDDNNSLESMALVNTTYTTANGIFCALPHDLTARDLIKIDCGGYTRSYTAANERGFAIAINSHDAPTASDLNQELSRATTSYTMGGADTLSKSFTFTPHGAVVTHAGTTKKQAFICIRCTGDTAGQNGTMACQGFLGYVLKAP